MEKKGTMGVARGDKEGVEEVDAEDGEAGDGGPGGDEGGVAGRVEGVAADGVEVEMPWPWKDVAWRGGGRRIRRGRPWRCGWTSHWPRSLWWMRVVRGMREEEDEEGPAEGAHGGNGRGKTQNSKRKTTKPPWIGQAGVFSRFWVGEGALFRSFGREVHVWARKWEFGPAWSWEILKIFSAGGSGS